MFREVVRVTSCSEPSTWPQVNRKSRRAERREKMTHNQRVSILQRQDTNKRTEQAKSHPAGVSNDTQKLVTITIPLKEVEERTLR